MGREAAHRRRRPGVVERGEQPVSTCPARHGGPVRRDRPRRAPVAHATRLPQECLDPSRKDGPRRRLAEFAAPPEQVRKAGVMRDDGAPANHGPQGGIRRLRLAGSAVQRLRHRARRDGQPEALAQQRGDLRVREAEIFLEHAHQRDGLGAHVHGGRPERVGGLERMPALHAPCTLATAANRDREAPDDRPQVVNVVAGGQHDHDTNLEAREIVLMLDAMFEIVEQRPDRYTCTHENGRPPENVGIRM